MSRPEPRECERLAGEIAVDIYDDFWAKTRFRYGNPAADYELLGSDEMESDDPYLTVLRRKSDGQLFEVAIEVSALAIEPPGRPELQVIPGQLALTEVAS